MKAVDISEELVYSYYDQIIAKRFTSRPVNKVQHKIMMALGDVILFSISDPLADAIFVKSERS